MKCILCGESIKVKKGTKPPEIARFFGPNVQHADGLFDNWEMERHMTFEHGFKRVRKDNTGRTAEAYYCVLDEVSIGGRTYRFGDFIEWKNKKLHHVPNSIYPNNHRIITSGYIETEL